MSSLREKMVSVGIWARGFGAMGIAAAGTMPLRLVLPYRRVHPLVTQHFFSRVLTEGDPKRALAKLQICFKADPRDVSTLSLLAEAFLMLSQTDKAISVYREPK